MGQSHYEILGLDSNADSEEIRRRYKELAKGAHPDSTSPRAAAYQPTMAQINEAWEVLGDIESRRAYDLGRATKNDVGDLASYARQNAVEASAATKVTGLAAESFQWPWIVVVFVATVIGAVALFVNTSVSPGSSEVNGLEVGFDKSDCVRIIDGPSLVKVPCDRGVARVIGVVSAPQRCSRSADYAVAISEDKTACLETI